MGAGPLNTGVDREKHPSADNERNLQIWTGKTLYNRGILR